MPSNSACEGSVWLDTRETTEYPSICPLHVHVVAASVILGEVRSGNTFAMDAFDIPRLRGVSHAYAFFVAVIAAVLLIVFTPGGEPRMAAAVYGAGLCALFG